MRKLFAFISVLFVLPLAAQDAGAVRQLQKLTQVYRYLNGLYVDEVDMQPLVESALTEKAIINFFNDIVAFYLIKVHWELITKRWLQNPVANSNAWLTTFYLVFLLVRYRKTK